MSTHPPQPGQPTPPPERQAARAPAPAPPPLYSGTRPPALALTVEQKRTSFKKNLKGYKSGQGKKKKEENVGNVV